MFLFLCHCFIVLLLRPRSFVDMKRSVIMKRQGNNAYRKWKTETNLLLLMRWEAKAMVLISVRTSLWKFGQLIWLGQFCLGSHSLKYESSSFHRFRMFYNGFLMYLGVQCRIRWRPLLGMLIVMHHIVWS